MDIKNYIFPIVLGNQEVESPVSYRLFEDGVYFYKRLSGGGALSFKVDGVPATGKGAESNSFLHRKMPYSFYTTIIEFFKHVCNTYGSKLEAYAFIGYNPKENKHCIYIPEQKVTGGSVHCTSIDKFFKEWPGYYIVLDMHSHPFLPIGKEPNFSSTDNANDINDRFSCVIGNPFAVIPKAKFRFGANGKFWDYTIDDLFEHNDETFELDFNKELSKIIHTNNNKITIHSSPSNISSMYDSFRTNNFFDRYIKAKIHNPSFNINDLLGEDW